VDGGDADRVVRRRARRPIPSFALAPETRFHACLLERTGRVRSGAMPAWALSRNRVWWTRPMHLAMVAADSTLTPRARSFPAMREQPRDEPTMQIIAPAAGTKFSQR